MRVMVDTNIFVSMIFFPSRQTKEVRRKLSAEHQILVGDYVLEELHLVTERKFPEKLTEMEEFFSDLPFVEVTVPTGLNTPVLSEIRDAKDYPLLTAAREQKADVFLTGDKDFLVLESDFPKIVTMKEFLETY